MAIAYVNTGTRTQIAGATSRTPALPGSRVNGNLIFATCGSKNNAVHSCATAGWSKLAQENSGAGWTVSLWVAVAGATLAAPAITWSGSVACYAQCIQYSRPNLANGSLAQIIGQIVSNTGSTSPHSCNGFTATTAGGAALYFDAVSSNTTALSTPSGWTENYDNPNATGATRNTGGIKQLANIGDASGAISVTGQASPWVMYQVEVFDGVLPGDAYSIANSNDDGCQASTDTGIRPSGQGADGGDTYGLSSGTVFHGAIRFQNVALAHGDTVASAWLTFETTVPVGAEGSGTNFGTIYGYDADDAPAWASGSVTPILAPQTTASVPAQASTSGNVLLAHDVTAIVQEIADRPGRATGGAVSFVIMGTGADGFCRFKDVSHYPSNGAKLYIEVDAGGGVEELVSASLSGSASASISAKARARSSASVSGTGQAAISAARVAYASASLSATGSMAAQAGRYTAASANLSASGSALAASTVVRAAAVSLSGSGAASASVRAARMSAAAFSAAGSVQSAARRTTTATASLTGEGSASVAARRVTHAYLSGEAQGTASASAIISKAASASLYGAGSISVSTRARMKASGSFFGEGSLTPSAQGDGASSVSLSGAGTMGVAARVEQRAGASLSAVGSAQAIGRRLTPASASLTAHGALSATIGADNEVVAVSLAGSGTLAASCRVERRAAAIMTGSGAMAVLARIEARSSAVLSGAGVLTAFAYDTNAPLPPASRQAKTPARNVSATTDIGNSEAMTRIGERQATTMKGRRAA